MDEYLCTFSGREGVIGAMRVYGAAFTSIAQTEPLIRHKVRVPTIALGGSRNGLGWKVGEMVNLVAERVRAYTSDRSGHFLPEEQPDFVIEHIVSMVVRAAKAA